VLEGGALAELEGGCLGGQGLEETEALVGGGGGSPVELGSGFVIVEEAIGAVSRSGSGGRGAEWCDGCDADTVATRDKLQHFAQAVFIDGLVCIFRSSTGADQSQPPRLPGGSWPRNDLRLTKRTELTKQIVDRNSAIGRGLVENETDFISGGGLRRCRRWRYRYGSHGRRGGRWQGNSSRDSRRLILSKVAQSGANRRNGARVGDSLAAMRGEQALEDIAGVEEGIDHVLAQRQFALADAIQQIFQDVRDFGQIVETEGAGRTLDRVRGAEDRIELLGVGLMHIQFEQHGFHAAQMLRGLLEEDLVKLGHVKAHDSFLYPLERYTSFGGRIRNAAIGV